MFLFIMEYIYMSERGRSAYFINTKSIKVTSLVLKKT